METNTDVKLFSNESTWLLNVITDDGNEKTVDVLTELEVLHTVGSS